MNMKALLFFVQLFQFPLSLVCISYKCGDPGAGNCASYISLNTTYVLSPCPSPLPYCPIGSLQPALSIPSSQQPPLTGLLAGLPCTSASNCLSDTCTAGFCTGTLLEASCTSSSECASNGYCLGSQCVPLLSVGSDCTDSSQCMHGSGCDSGTCKEYFSVLDYEAISQENCDAEYNLSKFCQSNACFISTASYTFCIPAFKSKNKIPHECSSSTDCPSRDNVVGVIYGPCVCGGNPSGKAYCDNMAGDTYPQLYREIFIKYYEEGIGLMCNKGADSRDCAQAWWDKKNSARFSYYYFMLNYQLNIYQADSCALQVLFPNYGSFLKNYKEFEGGLVVGLSILAFIFLT